MAKHIHALLAVVVCAIALTLFVGWRSLGPAGTARGAALRPVLPNPQLIELMPYTKPLPDSLRVLAVDRAIITLVRDPLGGRPAAAATTVAAAASSSEPKKNDGELRVTATMIAGARRAAVINDELLYVGDTVPGGGKLTSVEHDRIVVTDAKGAHVVTVKEHDG